jgi:hypothetical protein
MARRLRRLVREEQERNHNEHPILGAPGESTQRSLASRQTPNAEPLGATPSPESLARDAMTKRRQGELERQGTQPGPSASQAPDEGRGKAPEPGLSEAPIDQSTEVSPMSDRGGLPPTPGRTGQGYEHTPDTKVPSPLLDYRSRFEARYAERTGRHISASGRIGFGELRDFQRRYFESFTLHADVGAAEDPYLALLKRRWLDTKGGTR